jgi:hypothetical protein
MEHFVRIVMEKQDLANKLDESVFPNNDLYETEQGATVFEIPLPAALTEDEADEFAERLSNYMFEQGYDDFDIEFSTDIEVKNGAHQGYLISVGNKYSERRMYPDASRIIYDHDFAKALWGDKPEHYADEYEPTSGGQLHWYHWEYMLAEMVISEDPIKYLSENMPT